MNKNHDLYKFSLLVPLIGIIFLAGCVGQNSQPSTALHFPSSNTLFVDNITFNFVNDCSLLSQVYDTDVGNCFGWAYKQNNTVYLVKGYVGQGLLTWTTDSCNHEVYHVYSQNTTEQDHEYLKTHEVHLQACYDLINVLHQGSG